MELPVVVLLVVELPAVEFPVVELAFTVELNGAVEFG